MNSNRLILVAAVLTLASAASAGTADGNGAGTVDGNGALALAALVGETSPLVGANDKTVLAKFLDGQTNVTYPAGQTIAVAAGKITCRASNVDLTSHSCELAFDGKTVTLSGRRAQSFMPLSPRSVSRRTARQARPSRRSRTSNARSTRTR